MLHNSAYAVVCFRSLREKRHAVDSDDIVSLFPAILPQISELTLLQMGPDFHRTHIQCPAVWCHCLSTSTVLDYVQRVSLFREVMDSHELMFISLTGINDGSKYSCVISLCKLQQV